MQCSCFTIFHHINPKNILLLYSIFFVISEQRKKLILDGQTPHCPICGLTLRPGETESHLQAELEKLDKLSSR